jgi:tetratricopeptide (TPR) repeat protein
MEELGDRIPTSTLARIERGELDPGIRRLHLLLKVYRIPPHLVADVIELDAFLIDAPPQRSIEALFEEGVELWKHGDIARGLAWFQAVQERAGNAPETRLLRQNATLSYAVAARNLGKFRLALQLVQDLLCEPPDPALVSRVLVLGAAVWRGLGSLEMALALVRQASTHLDSADARHETWVLHQEAKLLMEVGRLDEAEQVLDRALAKYRELADPYGEVRGLILRVGILDRRGEADQAFACAQQALELARRHDYARLVIIARLELGRLRIQSGAGAPGLEDLREALGQAVLLGDKNAEFLAHYRLWKAYESTGDKERARVERETAKYFVRFVDDHSSEADEVRRLLGGV